MLYFFFEETNSLLHKHTEYKIIHRPEAKKAHVKRVHDAMIDDYEQKISKLEMEIQNPDCSEYEGHVISLQHELEKTHRDSRDALDLEHNKMRTLKLQIKELEEAKEQLQESNRDMHKVMEQLHMESINRDPGIAREVHEEVVEQLAHAKARIEELERRERELDESLQFSEDRAQVHEQNAAAHAEVIEDLHNQRAALSTELDAVKVDIEKHKNEVEEHKMLAEQHRADAELHKETAERHKADAEIYKDAADQFRIQAEKHKIEAEKHRQDAEFHKEQQKKMVHPELLEAAKNQIERLNEKARSLENEKDAHKKQADTHLQIAKTHEKTSELMKNAVERLTGRSSTEVLVEQARIHREKAQAEESKKCALKISGSSQAIINGCYKRTDEIINESAKYIHEEFGTALYYSPGQWIIVDSADLKRAYLTMKTSEGDKSPFGVKQWRVQQDDQSWVTEELELVNPHEEASAAVTACGDDGFYVEGATLQTMVNGCYSPRDKDVNGYPSFTNGQVILYWQPVHNGQWAMSDKIGSGYRAFSPAQNGEAGPTVFHEWHTLDAEATGWDRQLLTFKGKRAEAAAVCTNGVVLSGSSYQTEINGCYKSRHKDENGRPSFKNYYSKVLYWHPKDGGQWVISDNVNVGFRAFAPSNDMAPVDVVPDDWLVSHDAKWTREQLYLVRG